MQRAFWAVGLLGLISFGGGAGCSGASKRNEGERNDAGQGSSGDAGLGGSGLPNTAGRAGSGGQGGTAGTGGKLPLCEQEVSVRGCEGGRFFVHDPTTDECSARWFGCANNDNRFGTLEACLAACPSARPALGACEHAYDCELVDTTCCSACEPVDFSSKTGVNRTRREEFVTSRPCPEDCQDCAPKDELETSEKYLIPSCSLRCQVTTVSARSCATDSDCFLRDGAGCCEPCDGVGIVALSSLDYLAELCDPRADCAACESRIPSDLTAVCSPDWVCEVARL